MSKEIEGRKQLEICILAANVAYAALGMKDYSHVDLLKIGFTALIESVKQLEAAIPKR